MLCRMKYFCPIQKPFIASGPLQPTGKEVLEKNIENDLLQENCNKDIKKSIKMMGENKTVSAIERSSRSSGGERQIVENYDQQLSRVPPSSSHSHRSSTTDEVKTMTDL